MIKREWKSVEEEQWAAWRKYCDLLFAEKRPANHSCPSCKSADLRIFFLRNPASPTKGGFWVWCTACRRFSHSNSMMPSWWKDKEVPPGVLQPEPGWLEDHWSEIMD